jgi:glycosyltransferase involved in cell wall biosynthesis
MKLLTVAYDSQIFLLQKKGGISRYFAELINQFQINPELGIKPVLTFTSTVNDYLLDDPSLGNLKRVQPGATALTALAGDLFGRDPSLAKADLIHTTFYLPGFLSKYGSLKRVSTLYDMIPENTKRPLGRWNPHFAKSSYLSRADAVLSISNTSTADMVREYRKPIKATTTYLGVGQNFHPNLERLTYTPHPYFLFVGNRAGYKRWDVAVRAFADVASSFPQVRLELVGGGPLTASELKTISMLNVTTQVFQRDVPESELAPLYSNALALLYPTEYEGFGLPLVEAMASGVPILASDIPINREICLSAANLFPKGDVVSLATLMRTLLRSSASFRSKVAEGLDRSKNFTWYECARKTAEVYRSVLVENKVIS